LSGSGLLVKVLGFAHVTFCVPTEFRFQDRIQGLLLDQVIPNHAEKHALQLSPHELHGIKVYASPFHAALIELCIYPYPKRRLLASWTVMLQCNWMIRSRSRLRSKSFTPEFLDGLNSLFGIKGAKTPLSLQVPTLSRSKFVELSNCGFGPRFKSRLDQIGPVSLAFWVDSLETFASGEFDLREVATSATDVFELEVDGRVLSIVFLRLEGVLIELIARKPVDRPESSGFSSDANIPGSVAP
jgi:hypothetical protein